LQRADYDPGDCEQPGLAQYFARHPGQYNNYLYATPSSAPGSRVNVANPIFIADENSPAEIQYEICGKITSTLCNAMGTDCDVVTVYVKQDIEISLNIDPTLVCINNPLTLVANIDPASNYQYQWYSAPMPPGRCFLLQTRLP
jgi:hypothetical protein